MLDRTIILYADDFDCDAWKEYCDVVGASYSASSITIKFDHTDVETNEDCDDENDFKDDEDEDEDEDEEEEE